MDQFLGKYYQDFSQALMHYNERYFGDFDERGLPMSGPENTYNAILIIQYALIAYDQILDGIDEEANEVRMRQCVSWLEENEEEEDGISVLRNQFPYERYGLKEGWVSSMTIGQLISLYLRYGQHVKEEDKYIKKAEQLFKFFRIQFKDGGVMRYDKSGNFWLEEYPSNPPSFVLNGFVYTLFGIIDLWRISGNEEAKIMMDQCHKTLRESLHLYDSGYWSYYDQLHRELVSKYYHKNIHIPLVDILYRLTGEKVYLHYKNRWEKQLRSNFNYTLVQLMYRIHPRLQKLYKK